MGIDDLIEELRRDTTHGATWYLKRSLDIIEAALKSNYGQNEIRELVSKIESTRPGMATLKNLADIINKATDENMDINEVISKIRNYQENAERKIEEALRKYPVKCGSIIMSISYSTAVSKAVKAWAPCIEEIYLLESRPGNEVKEALKDYSTYAKTIAIPDSTMAHFMEQVDYVIVGADAVYTEGYFLNKVGTLTLAIVTNEMKRRFMVIFESYKACEGGLTEIYQVDYQYDDKVIRIPLFDKVPLDYIDYAVTDLGIIKKPSNDDVEKIRNEFINTILG